MSLFKLAMSDGAPIILEFLHTSTTKESGSELCMLHADCSVQQNQTKHQLKDLKCICFFPNFLKVIQKTDTLPLLLHSVK